MSISDWPVDQRPREKLLKHGAASLTDAELLAIFLRVGIVGKSAVDLGHELISHFGSLSHLFNTDIETLSQIKGIGAAKYVQLQAILEMSKRALKDTLSQPQSFNHISALKIFVQLQFTHLAHESLVVLFFNHNLSLIDTEILATGDALAVSLPTRLIAKRALTLNAHSLVLAHNHPYGNSQPSFDDINNTQILCQQLVPIGLHVLDHLIVADGHEVYSLAEHNQLLAT